MDELTLKNTTLLHKYIECDSCGVSNPPVRCSRCKLVFYCNVKCQKRHWKNNHKQNCCTPDEIKKLTYGDPAEYNIQQQESAVESNSSCGICMEEEMIDKVILPTCGHAFCFTCLKEWQEYTRKISLDIKDEDFAIKTKKACPICRTEIEQSVTEIAANRAVLLASRADRMLKSDQQQQKNELYKQAVDEIEKMIQVDENDIIAYSLKGQIVVHIDPYEAVKTFKKVFELDTKAALHYKLLEHLQQQISTAFQTGQGEKAIKELMPQFNKIYKDGNKDGRNAGMIGTDGLGDSVDDIPTQQLRKIHAGISRCSYHLGMYDKAITEGKRTLSYNRHLPGVHQLIALPLQKQGKVIEAMKVMCVVVVLYETPWDDTNRETKT